MLDYKFTLEAPMRALEAIVKPADIKSLSEGSCSICTLHKELSELSGAEDRLGRPNTMADLEYIGGGIAMSNKRLDEDSPASPAPGATLSPPK
eukprot:4721010-Pyramimonas_sp.AAC.1